MSVCAVVRDLLLASRILDAGARAGVDVRRLDSPVWLPSPDEVSLVLVDWSEREPDWGRRIAAWCDQATSSIRPRVILFGPHTDLDAHADAKRHGLGPMWARSKLVAELPALLVAGSAIDYTNSH